MLSAELRERVANATVALLREEGQGVLVPGGFILTAAHCIGWSAEGGMVLGDHCLETFRTRAGVELKGEVVAVEPVSDIAALASPDSQTFWEEAEAFDTLCATCNSIRIRADSPKIGQDFPVHILSHTGEWIDGDAALWAPMAASLAAKVAGKIKGGTSGGPVVDDVGLLVGLVSTTHEALGDADCVASFPRPYPALPCWVWSKIQEAMRPHSTKEVRDALADYFERAAGFRESLTDEDEAWNPKNEKHARCLGAVLEHVKGLPDDDPALRTLAACDRLFDQDAGFTVPEDAWQDVIHCQTDDPAGWFRDWAEALAEQ